MTGQRGREAVVRRLPDPKVGLLVNPSDPTIPPSGECQGDARSGYPGIGHSGSWNLKHLEVRIAALEQRVAEANAGGSSYGR